jgi:YD repeat-containing protein
MYDPPSTAYIAEFVPRIYRAGYDQSRFEYYKWYRGCQVGHRWVKKNNPDGTWKKTFYTSSYKSNFDNFDPSESQPDNILTTAPPSYSTVLTSAAGSRGLVWKEQSGQGQQISDSTRYYYSYVQEGTLRDREDYYWMLTAYNELQYNYILRTSIWPRLDSVTNSRDGVLATTMYQYNSTPRDPGTGNGLVSVQTEYGSNANRQTSYAYASSLSQYAGMDSLGMLSQLYSTTVRNTTTNVDMTKEFTTWKQFPSRWLPWEKFAWRGLPTDVTAPADTSGSNVIREQIYNYDNSGYSDLVTSTDANGYTTTYYYSSTSNFYSNDATGLSKGYVTGVVDPITSPVLRRSYQYDHFGNVTSQTDENGSTTTAQYNKVGLITSATNPLSQVTNRFSYSLPPTISSTSPNSITTISYRSSTDSTIASLWFDGAGNEREKMVSFGDYDIVTPTTYDQMWRVLNSYKPYQVSLGTYKHLYDAN